MKASVALYEGRVSRVLESRLLYNCQFKLVMNSLNNLSKYMNSRFRMIEKSICNKYSDLVSKIVSMLLELENNAVNYDLSKKIGPLVNISEYKSWLKKLMYTIKLLLVIDDEYMMNRSMYNDMILELLITMKGLCLLIQRNELICSPMVKDDLLEVEIEMVMVHSQLNNYQYELFMRGSLIGHL